MSAGRTAVDQRHFRNVLGHVPTGVCVVTGLDAGGQPAGMAANSFTSVSLSPPLIAFCPARSSTTWPLIRPGGHFAVNVLAEHQHELCLRFATRGIDRFAGVAWHAGPRGTPLLDETVAWLDCAVVDEHEAGTHTIVVAEVLDLASRSEQGPLVFHRGRYGSLG